MAIGRRSFNSRVYQTLASALSKAENWIPALSPGVSLAECLPPFHGLGSLLRFTEVLGYSQRSAVRGEAALTCGRAIAPLQRTEWP